MPILTADQVTQIAESADAAIYVAPAYRADVLRSFHAVFLRGRVDDVEQVRSATHGEERLWPRGRGPFLVSTEKIGRRREGRSLLINESLLTSASYPEVVGQLAVALGATPSDAREMAGSLHDGLMSSWRTLGSRPDRMPIAPDLSAIAAPEHDSLGRDRSH